MSPSIQDIGDFRGAEIDPPAKTQASRIDLLDPFTRRTKADAQPLGRSIQNLGQFRQAKEWAILLDQSFFDSHRRLFSQKVRTSLCRPTSNAIQQCTFQYSLKRATISCVFYTTTDVYISIDYVSPSQKARRFLRTFTNGRRPSRAQAVSPVFLHCVPCRPSLRCARFRFASSDGRSPSACTCYPCPRRRVAQGLLVNNNRQYQKAERTTR